MVWVKHFLDDNYVSPWKSIEIEMLRFFHDDPSILWKAEAPPCVLNTLKKFKSDSRILHCTLANHPLKNISAKNYQSSSLDE